MSRARIREITLTVRVQSKASEEDVRRMLEQCLCDTRYSYGENDGPTKHMHITGVDAGYDPLVLDSQLYEGVYPHLVSWNRTAVEVQS